MSNKELYIDLNKPSCKFNGGAPVSLCGKCSVMSYYVDFSDEKDMWIVKGFTRHSSDKVKIGDKAPLFCGNCKSNNMLIIEKDL